MKGLNQTGGLDLHDYREHIEARQRSRIERERIFNLGGGLGVTRARLNGGVHRQVLTLSWGTVLD